MPKRVVVVGAGVIGACCAYYLARAGYAVTIVDRGKFGAGCSHANCGYVCPSHVLPFAGPGAIWSTLKTLFRRNSPLKVRPRTALANLGWFLGFARKCNARDMLKSGHAIQAMLNSSRALFDELIRAERIECEWETKGLLFVFQTPKHFEHYAHTDELLTREFAMPAKRFDPNELAALEPALKPGMAGGYLYQSDGHLRPDRLMSELQRVLLAAYRSKYMKTRPRTASRQTLVPLLRFARTPVTSPRITSSSRPVLGHRGWWPCSVVMCRFSRGRAIPSRCQDQQSAQRIRSSSRSIGSRSRRLRAATGWVPRWSSPATTNACIARGFHYSLMLRSCTFATHSQNRCRKNGGAGGP